MTTISPNQVFIDAIERSAKKLLSDNKRKATEEVTSKRRKSKYTQLPDTPAACRAYSRHDGGITPDEVTEDISQESLDKLMSTIYETKVVITSEEAKYIEIRTRDQGISDERKSERRKRVTAPRLGGICKMRETTKKSNKVSEILYSSFRGNEATKFGSEMEGVTKEQYLFGSNSHVCILVEVYQFCPFPIST